MNRFNYLQHVQHFDAHNSNQKKQKRKKRKKIFSLKFFEIHATLRNILKINESILIYH